MITVLLVSGVVVAFIFGGLRARRVYRPETDQVAKQLGGLGFDLRPIRHHHPHFSEAGPGVETPVPVALRQTFSSSPSRPAPGSR